MKRAARSKRKVSLIRWGGKQACPCMALAHGVYPFPFAAPAKKGWAKCKSQDGSSRHMVKVKRRGKQVPSG